MATKSVCVAWDIRCGGFGTNGVASLRQKGVIGLGQKGVMGLGQKGMVGLGLENVSSKGLCVWHGSRGFELKGISAKSSTVTRLLMAQVTNFTRLVEAELEAPHRSATILPR